jgi:hypothetical protein
MLRRLLLCLALVIGVTVTSHRYVYFDPIYGTGWVTDYWDYERVGHLSFQTYLYTVPGYY